MLLAKCLAKEPYLLGSMFQSTLEIVELLWLTLELEPEPDLLLQLSELLDPELESLSVSLRALASKQTSS